MSDFDKQIEQLFILTNTDNYNDLSVSLDMSVSTIRSWRSRGRVPKKLLAAANASVVSASSADDVLINTEKKEWYTTAELIGLDSLPSNPSNIRRRAEREGWKKQQRSGVKGVAFEYHISSLPKAAQSQILDDDFHNQAIEHQLTDHHQIHTVLNDAGDDIKDTLYEQIIRKGLDSLCVSERDQRLIDLVSDLDDQEFKEIFDYIRKAKYALLAGYKVEPDKINAEIKAERKKQA